MAAPAQAADEVRCEMNNTHVSLSLAMSLYALHLASTAGLAPSSCMTNSTKMTSVHVGSPPNGDCCLGELQSGCRWREPGEPRLKDSSMCNAQLHSNALQPVPRELLQNNIAPAHMASTPSRTMHLYAFCLHLLCERCERTGPFLRIHPLLSRYQCGALWTQASLECLHTY